MPATSQSKAVKQGRDMDGFYSLLQTPEQKNNVITRFKVHSILFLKGKVWLLSGAMNYKWRHR